MKHKWNKKENKQDYDICLQCGLKRNQYYTLCSHRWYYFYDKVNLNDINQKFIYKAGICPNNLK